MIPLLANAQRRVDKHSDEFALIHEISGHPALCPEWRDHRHDDNKAGTNHQSCHLGCTTDVLHPANIGETEIAADSLPQVVAVEHISMDAGFMQQLFEPVGDRRLAGTRQAGQPDHPGPLPQDSGADRLVNDQRGAGMTIDVVGIKWGIIYGCNPLLLSTPPGARLPSSRPIGCLQA